MNPNRRTIDMTRLPVAITLIIIVAAAVLLVGITMTSATPDPVVEAELLAEPTATATATNTPTMTPMPPLPPATHTSTPTFTPTPNGWDWAEPNNEFGSGPVLAVQGTFNDLTIAPPGDIDYFRVFVKQGQLVNLTTFVKSGDTKLQVYSEGGSLIAENDDKSDRDLGSSVIYRAPQDEWLIVRIESAVPMFTAEYTFAALAESPTPTPQPPPAQPTQPPIPVSPTATPIPPPVEDDDYEPNNFFEEATQIVAGTTYNMTLPDGDRDFMRLVSKANTHYECGTSNLSGVDTIMTVYDGARNPIAGNDDRSATDVSSLVSWQSGENTEVVFIEVRAMAGRGRYSLYCTGVEPTPVPPPPSGGGGSPRPTNTPTPSPTPTPTRTVLQLRFSQIIEPSPTPMIETVITMLVTYDLNANGVPDIGEGIPNVSVRALSGSRQVGWALTNERGEAQIRVLGDIDRITIPFLSSWERSVRAGQTYPSPVSVQIPAIAIPVVAPVATATLLP
jgi:hypothetical protein